MISIILGITWTTMVCNSIQISPLAVEDAQVHKGTTMVCNIIQLASLLWKRLKCLKGPMLD